jgi:hypothetical protein
MAWPSIWVWRNTLPEEKRWQRRKLLVGLLAAPTLLVAKPNDRLTLEEIFDRAGIDFASPAEDGTKDAISIKVNGTEVTGVEGGMVIFKFTARGALDEIVVWNGKFENDN